MKLSARNMLSGKIVSVSCGPTTARIKIDVGNGVIITSSITSESAQDLGLKEGETVTAIIKSSDVIIGK